MSIEGQGHFLTLVFVQVIYIQNFKLEFSDTTVPFLTKFCMKAIRYKGMKLWWHDAGHIIKMATTPIYGKNPSKVFFSETGKPISTKLSM